MKMFKVFTKENQQPQPTPSQKFVMNLANTASVAASVVTLYSSFKFIKNELGIHETHTTSEIPSVETPVKTYTDEAVEANECKPSFDFISNESIISILMTKKMVIFDHHDEHDDPVFKIYRRNLYFKFTDECSFTFYQKKKDVDEFFKASTARFNRFEGSLNSIKIIEPSEEFNEFLIELVRIMQSLKK